MTSWTSRARAALGRAAIPAGLHRSTVYVADLEALRGIAIALVVLFHFAACILGAQPGVWVSPAYAFVSAGHTGVSLFFILSGFLLSRPFLREAAGGPRVSRADYYARRALRILPLYYLAVLVASLLCVRAPNDLRSTLAAVLFLNLFDVRHALMPYSAVWWSLSTEVQFYLTLPLLPVLLRPRAGRVVGTGVLVAGTVAYVALVTGNLWWPAGQFFLHFGLLGRAPLFAFGIGLAWLFDRHIRRSAAAARPQRRRGLATVALFFALLALGYLLRWVSWLGWAEADGAYAWWHLPEGALWSVVVWLILTTRSYLHPFLSNVFLGWLGVVSYSIYLVHYPLMDLTLTALRGGNSLAYIGWNGGTAVAGIGILVACLLLSAVTYHWVELPFLRRKALLDG